MATRKIRLTLSSSLLNGVGALADVDFNGENLDADIDVSAEYGISTLIKEYTVDAAAGSHILNVVFKNDQSSETDDRNLVIEKVEVANDGTNYERFILTQSNSTVHGRYGYYTMPNPDVDNNLPISESNPGFAPNPSYDPTLEASDTYQDGIKQRHDPPGDNSFFMYEFRDEPAIVYTGNASITVSFT
jgi:hypothetical protein